MTVRVVGASEGSIFLLNERGEVTRSFIARAELPPEVRVPTIRTVMEKGFAAWVHQNKTNAVIPDTAQDERWVSFPDDRLASRSAIGLPILQRDLFIGLLTLTSPEIGIFSEHHLQVLQPIVDQAGRAIENAALYTHTRFERATLDAVIHAVQEPILVLNEANQLILFNKMAEVVLGIRGLDAEKPLDQTIKNPDLLAFILDESVSHIQITIGEGRIFECNQVWIPALGQVISLHDITTLKKLDQLKSEYVSHVSHDLKNPLSLIQGYTHMIKDDPSQAAEMADRILHGIHRMTELIDNILDMGAIEMGIQSEFQEINIVDTINAVLEEFAPKAKEKAITLKNVASASKLNVICAPVRIHQAVSNLVGNALKFTPENGTIEVGTESADNKLNVWVRDSGPGIPPELQSRLFQKFSKVGQHATNRNEGHGLGLAIVKAVVEAHGGEVWVQSAAGEGATFWFSLPSQLI
jgi:signal transduction histidine kinase